MNHRAYVKKVDSFGGLMCPHCGYSTGMPLNRLVRPDGTGECVVCKGDYRVHALTAMVANAKRMESAGMAGIALHSLIHNRG